MRVALVLLAITCSGLLPKALDAQQKPVIAIIGTGNFAGAIGPALARSGYTVIYGSREPTRESVRNLVTRTGVRASAATQTDAVTRAAIVILAVPGEVEAQVANDIGDLSGKTVVDVSGGQKRIAADGYLELVADSTNSERIQARHSLARVVRINLPSIAFFDNPLMIGTRPTVLIAGNHPGARQAVAQLVFDTGLDPWDAGPLRFSRVFDEINVMALVPAQQQRKESYELILAPSIPLACFVDPADVFKFGRPFDLDSLPKFPRRDPVISCDEWRRRAAKK